MYQLKIWMILSVVLNDFHYDNAEYSPHSCCVRRECFSSAYLCVSVIVISSRYVGLPDGRQAASAALFRTSSPSIEPVLRQTCHPIVSNWLFSNSRTGWTHYISPQKTVTWRSWGNFWSGVLLWMLLPRKGILHYTSPLWVSPSSNWLVLIIEFII